MGNFFKKIYIFFMELVSWRDEFLFLKKNFRSPLSYLLSPISSLLSPMWQKLPYIYNNFFYYNNLSITFLNYRTIEKSPEILIIKSMDGSLCPSWTSCIYSAWASASSSQWDPPKATTYRPALRTLGFQLMTNVVILS